MFHPKSYIIIRRHATGSNLSSSPAMPFMNPSFGGAYVNNRIYVPMQNNDARSANITVTKVIKTSDVPDNTQQHDFKKIQGTTTTLPNSEQSGSGVQVSPKMTSSIAIAQTQLSSPLQKPSPAAGKRKPQAPSAERPKKKARATPKKSKKIDDEEAAVRSNYWVR